MSDIDDRKKRDEDIKASFSLSGIEFTDDEEDMFKMFDEKGFTDEQCIEYVKNTIKK